MTTDDSLFFVWQLDDIDSSFYEDTDDPQPLYVCLLCRDTEGKPDVIRGYDPRDGIFERPGIVLDSLGGIDSPHGEYARDIEAQMLAELEERRESSAIRGES